MVNCLLWFGNGGKDWCFVFGRVGSNPTAATSCVNFESVRVCYVFFISS